MITGILIVIVVISIIVSYIVGRVQGIPDGYCPCPQYPWDCNRDCRKICLYPTELKVREEQAYQIGKYETELKTMSGIRFTRFMSMSDQEKFLKRFNECVKPIDELRKDLEMGKF